MSVSAFDEFGSLDYDHPPMEARPQARLSPLFFQTPNPL
jgi:hypothetical protein